MEKYGNGNTRWFTHDRFGMFIHWGLYSMPARHEWVRNFEKSTINDYQVYFDLFDPDLFNPETWARAAVVAGMKYVVITTKHHEGFCLWDTAFTDYKVTGTAIGRDLLKEIIDAFRTAGLRVGLYYSLLDWHHPDFPIDGLHPQRDLPSAEKEKFNDGRDIKRYAQYMRDQVTELLTNYGKIDILWFDYSYPEQGKGRDDWESEKLISLVRFLQPEILVNNRLDLPGSGDIVTPEQFLPDDQVLDDAGDPAVWEGCHTFSGSWGYHRDESNWKSVKTCVELLVNHVARNGNLLMNVGPTSRGCIDWRAMDRLAGYGHWMKYNARAIYGCGSAPSQFPAPDNCCYTYHPERKRLYLHLFSWAFKHINLENLGGKVRYAQLLADGSEIKMQEFHCPRYIVTPPGGITLELPVNPPEEAQLLPVIELVLK